MSRASMAPPRNLTLTEELEKLEQSITLTLQEIDHNFSRAHRIVTSSILPIVEQYAKHSEAVWEGSKFWKQFFEASANVSLSGYEEAVLEDSGVQEDTTAAESEYETLTAETVNGEETVTATPNKSSSRFDPGDEGEDTSILESPSLDHAHSTPRHPSTAVKRQAEFTHYTSPYESLKAEVEGSSPSVAADPRTPGKSTALPDMSMTPQSSPFAPSNFPSANKPQDPLFHRVLDKNYRIAATPHTHQRKQALFKNKTETPGTASRRTLRFNADLSPLSSPEIAAPQLRADIFSSPLKAPRTPGVSVLTPRRKSGAKVLGSVLRTGGTGRQAPGTGIGLGGRISVGGVWDSDEDDLDEFEVSPPKTMQFHVPQSRLLQTPAREASKRIVEDLLLTAGADITDEIEEDSPSVVRRNHELDDSF
ncbi:hypothetical protein M501DRAFT_995992 [Patellaria atrata CBS 101060]|uniref:DASH complex subunit ASK1 n=1 Tax=Patellaria atrata CBS 101060 TaxID=1346257 RepID=A0A9P4S7J2_9PEZI|nr:hypothetical protein M501DRAFT_995992 [Patellaria atrata CBS 101060]